MHRNRNPCNSFLMVKLASGMDHGRVRLRTTTTNDDDDDDDDNYDERRRRTTSHNMAAIQLIPSHAVLDYSIYL